MELNKLIFKVSFFFLPKIFSSHTALKNFSISTFSKGMWISYQFWLIESKVFFKNLKIYAKANILNPGTCGGVGA